MNERDLIRAVADNFLYDDVQVPEVMPEPWRTIWYRTDSSLAVRGTVAEAVRDACRELPNRRALERAILRAMPSETEYESLEEVSRSLAPIAWLWKGWIPRGMLTLLGASPGAGKSLVALDLTRRIVHGLPWPDGQVGGEAGRVCIYIDAEAVPQIQNERAGVWCMDKSRLYLMMPKDPYGMIDLGDEGQQDRLVDMCAALSPELVVVDSMSAISVRGENNVEDVRGLLGFLMSVAREFSCGVLLIHHLRKRGVVGLLDSVGPDDFRGSSHIIAMARSVLALSVVQVGEEPDRNGPRRLEVIKTNLCVYPPALGLTLESGDERAPTLRYGEAPKEHRERTQAEECAKWLIEALALAGEPVKPGEIVKMAEGEGFSRRVVYRAREALGRVVVDTGHKQASGNRWRLAEDGEL